ncbi:hypothetical protein P1X14_08405 [Sphingomonas sp. AOB5]|uniref:hypothetical protein n=1 Tax=Sphingomonas sp. AOB5 TaxID=3034017 RepID=UPI0023F6DF43|nr:hypothetical protein [Sphingomonas sp. AOB5]MDF7775265.1 hypothetical protein [Sphingomonas sp. AOB5]
MVKRAVLVMLAALTGCAAPGDTHGVTSVSMRYIRPNMIEPGSLVPGATGVTVVETPVCRPGKRDRGALVTALRRAVPLPDPAEGESGPFVGSSYEDRPVRVDLLISLNARDGGFSAGIPMRAPGREPVRIQFNGKVSWIAPADLTIVQDIVRRSGCVGSIRRVEGT